MSTIPAATAKKFPWGWIIFGGGLLIFGIIGYIYFANRKFLTTDTVDASGTQVKVRDVSAFTNLGAQELPADFVRRR